MGSGFRGSKAKGKAAFDPVFVIDEARDWIQDNWTWLVPVVSAAIVLGLALYLLMLWLGSRGEFQFYHNVTTGRAEVVVPWHAYRSHGNSLFLFRLGLLAAGLLVVLPLLAVGGWSGYGMLVGGEARAVPLILFSVACVLLVVVSLVWAVISKLTRDFVVPVMAMRTVSCREAWGAVGRWVASDPGTVLLFLLFQFVLWIGVGIVLVAVILLTCCIAACFLAIPYLGTVLLLPVLVFFRSYSLHFLAQYGPEWNAFPAPAPGGSQ